MQAQYEAVGRTQPQPVQLVNHTWTEPGGTTHTLIVNQPQYGGASGSQVAAIPAPWEGAYRFYDRTLGAAERWLPFLALMRNSSSSQSTIYNIGGDGTVVSRGITPGYQSSRRPLWKREGKLKLRWKRNYHE